MATVDINVTGGGGADTNLGNSDQQIDISGFRNINLGGNTASDGLRIRNQSLTVQHEFNGVGDYRLIAGRFATGGALTSTNYGHSLNKTGTTANVLISNGIFGGRSLYLYKSGGGGSGMLVQNVGTSGVKQGIDVDITGGGTNTGIDIDVSGGTTNTALEIKSGDIKVPTGIGYTGTLNFNAPNSGDTATMTFDKGILVSSTQTP